MWIPSRTSAKVTAAPNASGQTEIQRNNVSPSDCMMLLENWERQLHEIEAIGAIYAEPLKDVTLLFSDNKDRILVSIRGEEPSDDEMEYIPNQQLKNFLMSSDTVIVYPNALLSRMKSFIGEFGTMPAWESPKFEVPFRKLYSDYQLDPPVIIVFLQSCHYLTTHIGFYYRFGPNYPSVTGNLYVSLVIALFPEGDYNHSNIPQSNLVELHLVGHLKQPPPGCLFSFKRLREIQEELITWQDDSIEMLELILRQGKELILEGINQSIEEDQAFQQTLDEFQNSSEKHQHDDENEEDDSVLAMECYSFPDKASSFDNVLGRRLFYSHHILSPIKRDLILSWGVELRLGGYSKIGHPGIIIVEGPEANCREYSRRLQHLRWRYFTTRGEQTIECSSSTSVEKSRALPHGMMELGTDRMDELARRCSNAGLRDLFLTSMKIYRRFDGDESKICTTLDPSLPGCHRSKAEKVAKAKLDKTKR